MSIKGRKYYKCYKNKSARGGTRTPTPVRAPDPKSGASANSATLADGLY